LLKLHKRGRREGGQTLILVTLALPLFLALVSLVIDGGNILVHKRNIQVAADAAALAMAQEIGLSSTVCTPACQDQGRIYAKNNGVDVDSSWHQCDATHTTNCWTYPYNGHTDEVEVRLKAHVTTFIAGMIGIYGADVSARAVSGTGPVVSSSTTPGTTVAGSTTVFTIPGTVRTTTGPDQLSGGSGVAFTMSRVCNSISYGGAGSGTWDEAIKNGQPGSASVLGAFATNGGVDFSGNAPKKLTWLAFDAARCMNGPNHDPDSPPSGTDQCTARAWNTPAGNPTDSINNCVQTLVGLNGLPLNWPIAPPTVPTPQTGAYDPASYPTKCSDVTSQKNGQGIVNVNIGNQNQWPAGIYCVTGGASFQISGVDATTLGHTFFALGGGTISLSSNGTTLKNYWPTSFCGPRPNPGDPRKGCVSGYDPYTLLYATYASADGNCAVCLQGQNGDLTGDIFATKPDIFPPIPTQTGGIIKVSGGALSAGQGFLESWNLSITGNTGTYKGTGASLVIPGQTTVTTDPDSTTTQVFTGTTYPGSVQVTTSGTDINLHE
jgi:Flp pilus assembly protein TadG